MRTCRWRCRAIAHRRATASAARSFCGREAGAAGNYASTNINNTPHGVGATVTQNLLNGFQTANRTRQAEAQVFAARETLRGIEQTVLLNAATAYMNLLARRRDSRTAALQRRGAAGAVAPDQRPLERRQRHRDRRVPGGVAPRRRPPADVHRRSQLYDLARGVPAGDRARAGQARAGDAGRPLLAAARCGRDGRRLAAKSRRHRGEVQRRRRRCIRSRSPRARSIRR